MFTRARVVNMKIALEPGTWKKLKRNSEYSKYDDFKKFSLLAQFF